MSQSPYVVTWALGSEWWNRPWGAGFFNYDQKGGSLMNGTNKTFSNNKELDPMLTTGEVARLLNLHINTVRRWSNLGVLKTYRIGSRGDRRFDREDIENFLEHEPGILSLRWRKRQVVLLDLEGLDLLAKFCVHESKPFNINNTLWRSGHSNWTILPRIAEGVLTNGWHGTIFKHLVV